jgi:hypothetical protein
VWANRKYLSERWWHNDGTRCERNRTTINGGVVGREQLVDGASAPTAASVRQHNAAPVMVWWVRKRRVLGQCKNEEHKKQSCYMGAEVGVLGTTCQVVGIFLLPLLSANAIELNQTKPKPKPSQSLMCEQPARALTKLHVRVSWRGNQVAVLGVGARLAVEGWDGSASVPVALLAPDGTAWSERAEGDPPTNKAQKISRAHQPKQRQTNPPTTALNNGHKQEQTTHHNPHDGVFGTRSNNLSIHLRVRLTV